MSIKSKYIFEKNIGNRIFLLNLFTFKYIILNNRDRELWERNKFNLISVIEQLKDEYFIVSDDSKLKNYAFEILSKKGMLNPHHVIYITDECNQRCPYCFECSIEVLNSEKKVLSDEQIVRIFDNILAINKIKNKKSSITLFGGEPLLRKNIHTVETVLGQVKKRLSQKVDIVTNGLTLNYYEELIQKFNQQIGTLIITLNGYKEKHDYIRGSIKKPTFDIIIRNIKHFLESTDEVKIRLNLMLDKSNISDMLPLLDYLRIEKISTNKRVNLAFGRIQFRVDPNNANYINELPHEDYYSSIFRYYYNNELIQDDMICGSEVAILSKIYKFWKYNNLVYPELKGCSAVYPGRFCYFIDDNIYPCTEIAGVKEFSIGNYMDSGIDIEKYSPWENYKVINLNKCRECKYIGLCNGSCLVSNITSNGKFDEVYCLKIEEALNNFINILFLKGFFDEKN